MSKSSKKIKISAWFAAAFLAVGVAATAQANVFDSSVTERNLGEMRLRDHRGSQLECVALDAKSSLDSAEAPLQSAPREASRSAASAAQ